MVEYFVYAEGIRGSVLAGLEATTLYITVVSAYLIAIHVAGARLEKFQIFLVTALFVTFATFFTIGTYGFFYNAYANSVEYGAQFEAYTTVWYARILGSAQILGIIGALIFMIQIRYGKSDS